MMTKTRGRLALAIAITATVSGCGYKPLEAPCSMGEGGGPLVTPGREEPAPSGSGAVQTLFFAEPAKPVRYGPFVAAPKTDDCGPLRPINAGALR